MANIIETAKGAGLFSTLLTAVEVAGLTAALESPGPFTVFAPVDDAFAALPPGTVQTLVDNPPQLARILKFHVLSGAYSRSDLVDQPSWESLEGAPIPIRCAEPFEVKNASVVAADIVCDNGIVHVINRVMLPG
ncbi:fasciclin domain-containing protein [Synechococcus sp. CS-1325]|uniref:fasciclin domain-containing protein n=1 Tax=Synechococcus sp. CS-1325 TaxID=2847979 RepID=UPI000DB3E8D8|nr:fasciclin domain-containing protein [Synechococcus sp. CS-1325]MCT0198992.1 fasciclin domain-containing protein [Synechococcus sp. CS-1325]PZU95881.1 MAG: fasciclin [Cyanobium sp.]